MESLIKQISMRIFHADEEDKAQPSRMVRNRKISSRRTRSSKGDSQKGNTWKQTSWEKSLDHDKTDGEEFRTAVAAAAFVVNSIENNEHEINQPPSSSSRKSFSEIQEVSSRTETDGDFPTGANQAMPGMAAKFEDKSSRKTLNEKTPDSLSDIQAKEKTSKNEPEPEFEEADVWEKTEMEKIKDRFLHVKAKIFEWEKKKKSKAKKKLVRTEGKLEWKRAQSLQDFKRKVETIETISQRARSQAEEKRKNEETMVKKKADRSRSTGNIPRPTFLCC